MSGRYFDHWQCTSSMHFTGLKWFEPLTEELWLPLQCLFLHMYTCTQITWHNYYTRSLN